MLMLEVVKRWDAATMMRLVTRRYGETFGGFEDASEVAMRFEDNIRATIYRTV